MAELSTGAIYSAISALEREAEFRRNVGGNSNHERARDLDHYRREAEKEERALSSALPRLRDLKAEADRAYDRYVTRAPIDEGCSCHISPPCGYCARQSDENGESPQALTDTIHRIAKGR